ncbi:MAG: hypothetical protein ACE361_20880 [Aureliella sp.]
MIVSSLETRVDAITVGELDVGSITVTGKLGAKVGFGETCCGGGLKGLGEVQHGFGFST